MSQVAETSTTTSAETTEPVSPIAEPKKKKKLSKKKTVGSVIILALMILTPVMVAGGSMMSSLNAYSREVQTRGARRVAQAAAISGAHDTLTWLNEDPDFEGEREVESETGFASVVITQLGAPDPSQDDLVEIRSEGWLSDTGGDNWHRSVVLATARKITTGIVSQQTLYVDDPYGGIAISGPNVNLAGEAANPDSDNPEGVFAIGTPGGTEAIEAGLSDSTLSAMGGSEAVGQTEDMDLEKMMDAFADSATLHLTGGGTTSYYDGDSASYYDGDNTSPTFGNTTYFAAEDTTSLSDEDRMLLSQSLGGGQGPALWSLTATSYSRAKWVVTEFWSFGETWKITGAFKFAGLLLVGGKLKVESTQGFHLEGGLWVQGGQTGPTVSDMDQVAAPAIEIVNNSTNSISINHNATVLESISQAMDVNIELVSWEQDLLDTVVSAGGG